MHRLASAMVLVTGLTAAACAEDEAQRAAQQFAEAFQRSLDANDVATLHRMWPAEARIGGWEKAYLQPRLALGQRRTSLEYLQDVNPHPPARGMTLSYSLEFERGEAYEEFAIRMDGNVPHLITYQFFPGKRFECYPIGGCSVVDVPQKTALRINPQRRIGAAAGLRNRLTEFFDVPGDQFAQARVPARAADHEGTGARDASQ